jgi:FKBP-type peptidyl-prolyl cis-trans isomerase
MMFHNFHQAPVFLAFFVIVLLIFVSCDNNRVTGPDYSTVPESRDTTGVERFEAENGLVIYFHQYGDGAVISENDAIRVHYTGRRVNGDIFDSSYRDGLTTPATLQLNNVVRGFMQGLAGVHIDGERRYQAREGAIRTLVIPPALGYGGTNHQLRQDTLIFEIEVFNLAVQN